MRHHVRVDDSNRWHSVVAAERLRNPAVINDLWVTKAFVTGEGQPLDEAGTEGRWPVLGGRFE